MSLEFDYIRNLSSSLQNFRVISHKKVNFRCPLCGDSRKNVKKSRGYLLQEHGKVYYYCHNCNQNLKFQDFLKIVNPMLHDEYVKDKIKENSERYEEYRYTKEFKEFSLTRILNLPKISQLDENHIAKKFVRKRCIPNQYHSWLYYAHNYKQFTNQLIEGYFEKTEPPESRLIIPLINSNKKLLGFQGRTLDNKSPDRIKYITILFADDNPKLYNLDRVNFNKRFYVLEGPIDSMFINNSIATCGGKITSAVEDYSLPTDNLVVLYDNNPRNPQVVQNVRSAIDADYRVFIWPDHIHEKDINDLVLKMLPNRYNNETIVNIGEKIVNEVIEPNIYHGLKAKLRFVQWKKI